MGATTGIAKQRALLQAHLEQVSAVLAPLRGIDGSLYQRLQPLLQLEVMKLRDRIDQALSAQNPWAELRSIQDHAAGLFTESLGFLGGAVALHADLDGGLCRIANHLVAKIQRDAELAGHAISVPAEREYVNALSSLIRLRFPGNGVWDLPIVVHELGHTVFSRVGDGAAREATVAMAGEEQPKPGRLILGRYEELWCDVFAAYVAGPAYAATCMRLRFDPSTAGADDGIDTHPSVDRRTVVILATLAHLEARRMKTGAIAGSLRTGIEGLEEYWEAELAEAGRLPPVPSVVERGTEVANRLCAVLDAHVPTIRFPGLAAADGARPRLERGEARPSTVGVIDTLNAAWSARGRAERRGQSIDHLTQRALAWCAEVADG